MGELKLQCAGVYRFSEGEAVDYIVVWMKCSGEILREHVMMNDFICDYYLIFLIGVI